MGEHAPLSADRAALWHALADAFGRVPGPALAEQAARLGLPLREAEAEACDAGCMPMRYSRNARTLDAAAQARLLRSRVLLAGLGGLGGHVLDMLARVGVGHITGVDGDVFEESNANRQLLLSAGGVGESKARAAVRHAAAVNPALRFVPVERFVRGEEFAPLAREADVVVDALGGFTHRPALHAAAVRAGKPLVSAGIAGFTGWVAVTRPGESDPLPYLEKMAEQNGANGPAGAGAEEMLGNLAPTAAMAAALECAEIIKLLTGRESLRGMLVFDMQDLHVTRILPQTS